MQSVYINIQFKRGYRMEKDRFIEDLCAILSRNNALKSQDSASLKLLFKEDSAARFEDFLIDEGLVEKEDVLKALGEYYDMPAVDVAGIFFDHHLLRMFPKDLMMRDGFIPFEHDGDILTVVTAYPNDELPALLKQFVSYEVTQYVGIYTSICDAIEEYFDASPAQLEIDDLLIQDSPEEPVDVEAIIKEDE